MEKNFSRTKQRKKGRLRELCTDETTEKKTEKAILAATEQPQTLVLNYLTVLRSFHTNLKKL